MIGKVISHYKILEKLGEGGMGVVYKAEDSRLQRTVALKFLPHGLESHEPERARFLQEARAASALNHPNVCTIYDVGDAEGQQFIAMEFVDGVTLREKIARGKLQTGTAISYAIQIGEALEEAHSKGIVHRDIKAENIMINAKNQVKVMDFGLAKLRGSLKLTRTSSTIGTLAYMAPEQIQGGEVDARSDIFSFGTVLYEMLTGHLPFRGEHEAAMMYAIVNEEPESLQQFVPDASSELVHVLDRALEKDPEERYQTVRDMLIDLRRLKKDSSRVSRQIHGTAPVPPVAVSVPVENGKKGANRQLLMGLAGLVILCAALALLWLLRTPLPRLNPNRTYATLRIPFERINYLSLSRDGNWIVFPARDENLTWDIYWMNTATGKPSKITAEGASWIGAVDISPDASQVAYDCRSEPGTPIRLKIAASQGGGSRTLTDIGEFPKWKPDGSRIGYSRGLSYSVHSSVPGCIEIWSIRPDGTDNRLELTDSIAEEGANFAFDWSPDGESLVWTRNYTRENGDIFVRESATGKERQLTSDRQTVDEVVWATNDQILFISTKSGLPNLWTIPAAGGDPVQVTQGSVPILTGRISADNKTLVYMHQEWIGHIVVSGIDGSNARQLTFDDAFVSGASFSPDGKQIAFQTADVDIFNSRVRLLVMDCNGKNQVELTSGSEVAGGSISNCRWSPDGRWLAYSSRVAGEPVDSLRVYLIQPANPAPPRFLCLGKGLWWLSSESLAVFQGSKTMLYPIAGGTATQIYQDSTYATPDQANTTLFIYDFREGREGYWTVALDRKGMPHGEPKRDMPSDVDWACPQDQRFIIYRKAQESELRRRWTSTLKEEVVGKAIPGQAYMYDISSDAKQILWVKREYRSRLVLVKNVFE
ncbi:MAG: serine/threonine protein kinase [Bacteroidetes bacterium]|nr:serine/threonine protein kinase [Bacteroidota bacterium]